MAYIVCPKCSCAFSTEKAGDGASCPQCGVVICVRQQEQSKSAIVEQGTRADQLVGGLYLALAAISLAKGILRLVSSLDRQSHIAIGPSALEHAFGGHGYEVGFLLLAIFLAAAGLALPRSKAWVHQKILLVSSIAAPVVATASVPLAMVSIPMLTFSMCRLAGIVGVRPSDDKEPTLIYYVEDPKQAASSDA